ncbi:class I SAM-dependent methyltransferase [Streptomyces sp. PT12]|uniref:class I SAM-dependent DNA methyltransferase n=1 Tax=Streptomyces sp. PT12 TaxID=1510197 RepID=UPI000DE3F48E|nr:class I SAM-dependent methyltransferase [Streptomyces sp. PT12]RBM18688.1 SAM-dependent methyltransferase [Streptomyces sp. PT12]
MAEFDFLDATRDSYDALAEPYAEAFGGLDLANRPLDRALYGVFAELVTEAGGGPVADVGCGPGWLTDALVGMGLDAFGVDLSPGMVALARRTYPALRFDVGSMLSLDLQDGALGGVLAAYSLIHVPWELRPAVFAEFHRVLAPGGHLMLVFQVGDEHAERTEAFGQAVRLHWYRQRPEELGELLTAAGFEVLTTAVRRAREGEKAPQGYVIGRRKSAVPR